MPLKNKRSLTLNFALINGLINFLYWWHLLYQFKAPYRLINHYHGWMSFSVGKIDLHVDDPEVMYHRQSYLKKKKYTISYKKMDFEFFDSKF